MLQDDIDLLHSQLDGDVQVHHVNNTINASTVNSPTVESLPSLTSEPSEPSILKRRRINEKRNQRMYKQLRIHKGLSAALSSALSSGEDTNSFDNNVADPIPQNTQILNSPMTSLVSTEVDLVSSPGNNVDKLDNIIDEGELLDSGDVDLAEDLVQIEDHSLINCIDGKIKGYLKVRWTNSATSWAHWKNVTADMGSDVVTAYMNTHGLEGVHWRDDKPLLSAKPIYLKDSGDVGTTNCVPVENGSVDGKKVRLSSWKRMNITKTTNVMAPLMATIQLVEDILKKQIICIALLVWNLTVNSAVFVGLI